MEDNEQSYIDPASSVCRNLAWQPSCEQTHTNCSNQNQHRQHGITITIGLLSKTRVLSTHGIAILKLYLPKGVGIMSEDALEFNF